MTARVSVRLANLLGAMVGGVAEYLSLLMGFQFLLLLAAVFYLAALATRKAAPAAAVLAGMAAASVQGTFAPESCGVVDGCRGLSASEQSVNNLVD